MEQIEYPDGGGRKQEKEVVVITGSSGLIGFNLIKRLARNYRVIGLDRVGPPYPPLEAECVNFNIRDQAAIARAMERIRYGYGNKIASVIHLAAYYNFSEEDSPMYDEITVKGTEKFLSELDDFEVDQFVFSSTDLIYKPTEPGIKIDEDCPVAGKWGYPESKIVTEDLIKRNRGSIPVVILRIAGVYNDEGHSIPITNQIKRIYDRELTSHFYSGDLDHGDVYVHLDDLLDAIVRTVDRRHELPEEIAINIGEPETPTYGELQQKIGELVHGEEWETYEVPKALAKAGAWSMNLIGNSFIKPWMIDRAGEHYELDISRAGKLLGWQPKHRLMETLPVIIKDLKEDPEKWMHKNGLK